MNKKTAKSKQQIRDTQISNLKQEIKSWEHKQAETQLKLDELRRRLDELHSAPIMVTDHAIVRFLERVKGIDIEKLKQEITDPELIEQMRQQGDNGTFVVNNLQYVVNDRVIVTMYPALMTDKQKRIESQQAAESIRQSGIASKEMPVN